MTNRPPGYMALYNRWVSAYFLTELPLPKVELDPEGARIWVPEAVWEVLVSFSSSGDIQARDAQIVASAKRMGRAVRAGLTEESLTAAHALGGPDAAKALYEAYAPEGGR